MAVPVWQPASAHVDSPGTPDLPTSGPDACAHSRSGTVPSTTAAFAILSFVKLFTASCHARTAAPLSIPEAYPGIEPMRIAMLLCLAPLLFAQGGRVPWDELRSKNPPGIAVTL